MPYPKIVRPRQRPQRPLSPKDPRQPTSKRQGLTRAEVDALVARQQGRCVLCRRELDPNDSMVDHDHVLAATHGHNPNVGCPRCVRGVLDRGCNSWLSGFRDDPDFLLRASAYSGSRRSV